MADGRPDRRLSGRVIGSVLAALGLVVLVVWAVVTFVDDGADDATPGAATESNGDPDASDDGVVDPFSAARGPEGTRSLDEAPTEFPDGLVPDDATEVGAQAARVGDDWSALLSFAAAGDRDTLEDRADAASDAAGYTRREATSSGSRRVVVYDGPAGEVLAVTLEQGDGVVRVSASLVGPP